MSGVVQRQAEQVVPALIRAEDISNEVQRAYFRWRFRRFMDDGELCEDPMADYMHGLLHMTPQAMQQEISERIEQRLCDEVWDPRTLTEEDEEALTDIGEILREYALPQDLIRVRLQAELAGTVEVAGAAPARPRA